MKLECGLRRLTVSHLSFDTGWKVPFVYFTIRSHWIGS